MSLPTSRNTTYAAGSQVKSADLNAMQDQIVLIHARTLSGIQSEAIGSSGSDNLAIAADTGILRADPAAGGGTLTGMTGGADGRAVEIWNVDAGSDTVTLAHQSASSTAANRFICPGGANLVLAVGERASARYFSSESRWRVSK